MTAKIDEETKQFMADLLLSLDQAKRGEYAAVHTPEMITAYKTRGRPLKANAKQPVKLRLDPDVLAGLRATGRGWQTRVNDTMRDWLRTHSAV